MDLERPKSNRIKENNALKGEKKGKTPTTSIKALSYLFFFVLEQEWCAIVHSTLSSNKATCYHTCNK